MTARKQLRRLHFRAIITTLGLFSKIVLILLMFFGRVGGLTFLYAAVFPKQENFSKLPLEKINIG